MHDISALRSSPSDSTAFLFIQLLQTFFYIFCHVFTFLTFLFYVNVFLHLYHVSRYVSMALNDLQKNRRQVDNKKRGKKKLTIYRG